MSVQARYLVADVPIGFSVFVRDRARADNSDSHNVFLPGCTPLGIARQQEPARLQCAVISSEL